MPRSSSPTQQNIWPLTASMRMRTPRKSEDDLMIVAIVIQCQDVGASTHAQFWGCLAHPTTQVRHSPRQQRSPVSKTTSLDLTPASRGLAVAAAMSDGEDTRDASAALRVQRPRQSRPLVLLSLFTAAAAAVSSQRLGRWQRQFWCCGKPPWPHASPLASCSSPWPGAELLAVRED